MRWKWLAVCPGVALASAASATEIALEFDQKPEFALAGPAGNDMRLARYAVGGVEVELTALGSGFGYVETLGANPDDDVSAAVVANGRLECGDQPDCNPYVASFSIALDAIGVDFLGIGDFSGADSQILSSGFFLQAWSGPEATGTLLASAFDPGGGPGATLPTGGFVLPASLDVTAPGIRSIVFGATSLIRADPIAHNLSIVERVRMTVTPEPATGVLLSAGLAVVGWRRRRWVPRATTSSCSRPCSCA